MGFNPSEYQLKIFDFLENGYGHLIVNSVAGSGKTSTIEMGVQRLMAKSTKSIALIAFNRTIKAELLRRLGDKLSDKEIKTVHGLGWAAINYAMRRKPIVTQTKYRDLAKKWWEEANLLGTIPEPILEAIADSKDTDLQKTLLYDIEGLHRFIRYDLINPQDVDAIRDLCHSRDFYPLFFDTTLDGVRYLFKHGWEEFERNSTVDFTDLVYYPASRPDIRPLTFDLIFVDEAQDLSKMALELILKCQKRGGRLTFIGDSRQAIYAFAGADAKSWDNIIDRVKPIQLPLSKNYRCPTTVIDLAKRLVPQIEAHDGAETGAVRYMAEPLSIDEIMGDPANVLILGRLNAPLIGLAIRFIQRRVAAKVKGRDIGKEFITVLEAIAKQSGFTYEALPMLLQDYLKRQTDFLESQGASEMAIQAISDKIEALQICYTDFGCADLGSLIKEIEALFEDHLTPIEFLDKFPTLLGKFRYKNQRILGVRGDNRHVVLLLEDSSEVELTGDSLKEELIQREIVWLSTVHKAKGLEEERIYIVNPEQIPLKFKGQSPSQYQQELNLAYVAITRAKKSLTIMGRPNKDGDKLQFFSIDLLNDTAIGKPAPRIDEDLQALDKKHGIQELEQLQTLMTTLNIISDPAKDEIIESENL